MYIPPQDRPGGITAEGYGNSNYGDYWDVTTTYYGYNYLREHEGNVSKYYFWTNTVYKGQIFLWNTDYGNGMRSLGGFNNQNVFDLASGLFNNVGGLGAGLQEMGGSFRLTNGAYNGSRWSPHHYKTSWIGGSVARITTYNSVIWGGRLSGGATGIGLVMGSLQVKQGYKADGNTFGYNALTASGSTIVGIAGGWSGAVTFAGLGFSVAGPPGAIIGGLIGGFGMGWAGSYVGGRIVDLFY